MKKKIIAAALTLALLLASLAAWAEPMISTVELKNLSVAYVENGRAKTAHLKGMALTLSAGSAEGVPTLMATFDNGKGQMVDGVFQIVDDRLLVSVGGISGTYYVDLESLAAQPGDGARLARSVGSGLALAGGHLDAMLQALSTVDASGERMLEFDLPADLYTPIAEDVLNIVGGVGFVKEKSLKKAEERLEEDPGNVALIVRYTPKSSKIEIDAVQGGEGIRLNADMTLTAQPMLLPNVSTDEMMYDLMHLNLARLMELRGEMAIIALKFVKFAGTTGLSRLMG